MYSFSLCLCSLITSTNIELLNPRGTAASVYIRQQQEIKNFSRAAEAENSWRWVWFRTAVTATVDEYKFAAADEGGCDMKWLLVALS